MANGGRRSTSTASSRFPGPPPTSGTPDVVLDSFADVPALLDA
ncbi:MAG: hypothetical protein V1249_01615 [Acidimicrobiales bacterium]|nr:hypothetical protein [Acidimicrobiales bacterium]